MSLKATEFNLCEQVHISCHCPSGMCLRGSQFYSKHICIKQPPEFKGHFTLSFDWLLKTGMTTIQAAAQKLLFSNHSIKFSVFRNVIYETLLTVRELTSTAGKLCYCTATHAFKSVRCDKVLQIFSIFILTPLKLTMDRSRLKIWHLLSRVESAS